MVFSSYKNCCRKSKWNDIISSYTDPIIIPSAIQGIHTLEVLWHHSPSFRKWVKREEAV